MSGRVVYGLAAFGLWGAIYSPVAAWADTAAESSRSPASGSENVLLGVTISGATILSGLELAGAYEPYLARPYDMADLVEIANAITQRYHARGYFLSRAVVVSAELDSGVAQIAVIEGEISEVTLAGSSSALVGPLLIGLEGAPGNLAAINRQIMLASDVPGVRARAHVEPDIDDPARHRLVVEADRDRFSGLTYLDNRGSERVGPWQLYSRVDANGALLERDQLSLGVFSTPGDVREFALIETRYRYVFQSGARAFAIATVSNAGGGPDDTTPDVGGEGQSLSVGYEVPLLRGRDRSVWIDASIDARSLSYDWLGGGRFADELRVARVALRGTLNDAGRATTFSLRASLGGDVLGSSGRALTRRSRADADADFASLNFHASHYQDFGSHFGAFVSIDGQWASEALLASEEFAIGGMTYGRAYEYGAITGDRGVAGLMELRAGFDPPGQVLSFLQTYAFADTGHVWNKGAQSDARASSAGFGIAATFAERITARWEWAEVLSGSTGSDGATEFFSLLATY